MANYKCAYCGKIGNSSVPPQTNCIQGKISHAWRRMFDNKIIEWKCRKCGVITYDDQTPNPLEGGACPGGGNTHTWDRMK